MTSYTNQLLEITQEIKLEYHRNFKSSLLFQDIDNNWVQLQSRGHAPFDIRNPAQVLKNGEYPLNEAFLELHLQPIPRPFVQLTIPLTQLTQLTYLMVN